MPLSGAYHYPGINNPPQIAGPLSTYSNVEDPQTRVSALFDPFRNLVVAEKTRLIGGNSEVPLDTRRWITSVFSGTILSSSGLFTLNTNGNVNASASIETTKKARFLSGMTNIYLAGIRLGDTGVVNNIRRFGAYDSNNGAFFELSGTTINCVSRFTGSDTRFSILNGSSSFTKDTNFHVYEIIYAAGSAHFYQDRRLIHSITTPNSSIFNSMHVKAKAENFNSNGSSANTSLFVRGQSICRFGKEDSRPLYYHTSISESIVLKQGPGTLYRVIVGVKGNGGSTMTLYDNTSATGSIIGVIDLVNTLGEVNFNLDFDNGLAITTSSTVGDVTVIWD